MVDMMEPPILRSTIASLQPRAVRSGRPVVMSATDGERQRRSISQPRVGRASGLPWDCMPHARSTLKGLHLPASVRPHGTDATLSGPLSGLAGLRALTQGRRWRANPGLIDGIPSGFNTESPPRSCVLPTLLVGRGPCAPRAPSVALAQIRIRQAA